MENVNSSKCSSDGHLQMISQLRSFITLVYTSRDVILANQTTKQFESQRNMPNPCVRMDPNFPPQHQWIELIPDLSVAVAVCVNHLKNGCIIKKAIVLSNQKPATF